jgi:hypothetical protein
MGVSKIEQQLIAELKVKQDAMEERNDKKQKRAIEMKRAREQEREDKKVKKFKLYLK